MSNIIVRQMTASDIYDVVNIEKECFSSPWSEKSFEDSLTLPYAIFFVAEVEGKIAGYVGLYKVGDEADITNVAVSSVYRRRGVARKLMEMICDYGVSEGIVSITLEVRESNDAAITLYEGVGFENVGIRKNFYEKPIENAIIMVRILQSPA